MQQRPGDIPLVNVPSGAPNTPGPLPGNGPNWSPQSLGAPPNAPPPLIGSPMGPPTGNFQPPPTPNPFFEQGNRLPAMDDFIKNLFQQGGM